MQATSRDDATGEARAWPRGSRLMGKDVGQKALVWMVVSASRLAMEATGQVGRIKAAAGNSACDGSSRGEG